MQTSSKVRILVFCAICIAIAFVLGQIRLYRMPQGGSLNACAMLFVALTGYWYGIKWGAAAGTAYGLLSMIIDPFIIHPIQFLLDYPLAYMALGALPALMRRNIFAAFLLGVAGRFLCAFISGVVFFSELSPDGEFMLMASVINSVVYNASYIVPEAVLTLLLLTVPALRRVIEGQKT
ncbi:MAG: energy-coupled thiamine transporter ThiT [Defluviitaleaceae bacterium]|nr:energy-coupled thiamine transporter ThiT [Defluviitaleaceae bacterium]